MRQLLDDHSVTILQTRVQIARIIRLVTFDELAKEWGMSKATLYRYVSPDYRELSRESAREAHKKLQKIDRTKCHTCLKPIVEHARCPYCTILVHSKPCDCATRIALIRS